MKKLLLVLLVLCGVGSAQEDSATGSDRTEGRWVMRPQLQVSPKTFIPIYNNDTVHIKIWRLDSLQADSVLLVDVKAIKNKRSDSLNTVVLQCFGISMSDVLKGDTVAPAITIDSLIMDGKGVAGSVSGVPNKSYKRIKLNQYVYGVALLKRKNHAVNDIVKICKLRYKNTTDVPNMNLRVRSFTATFLDVPCDTCGSR